MPVPPQGAASAPADQPLLMEFHHVTRLYGTVLGVNDIDVSLPPGGYGLIGPNGAGKTTLLHLLMGLLRPTLGRVTVMGEDPWQHRPSLSHIGYCPSQDGLYGDVSGFEWVRYLLELHGRAPAESRRRAAEMLEHVGLQDAMHRAMGTYSRGMRQRVKLAQAMAHDPRLLILDEPFNGLDPVGRHAMTVWLQDWLTQGRSLILASHVLHEVESVTPRFLLICGGRLLASGATQDVQQLLAGIPHEIRIESPHRERLASLLIDRGWIESMRLADGSDELTVCTRQPLELFQQLPGLCSEHQVEIRRLESTDDSLQSLFDNLFRLHRGEW